MTARQFNFVLSLIALVLLAGCDMPQQASVPKSASGVTKATAEVKTGSDGLTAEQRNIVERLKRDNTPGATKHLYVISSYTGQVLVYSTVKGKVTSGSKRLTPSSVWAGSGEWGRERGFHVGIGGEGHETTEVLGDDGTYGSSGDYLYWFDTQGAYHQIWREGCILLVTEQPINVKQTTQTIDLTK